MKKKIIIFEMILIFLASFFVYAHPGGLDESGGHWDNKAGTYHYHEKKAAAEINIESVEILDIYLDLEVGVPKQLTAEITPKEVSGKALHWSVSDENIAVISQDGIITGLNEGKVKVLVKCGNMKDSVTLTVTKVYAKQVNIRYDKSSLTLGMLDIRKTLMLTSEVFPENSTDNIILSLGDKNLAKLENGELIPTQTGKLEIIATGKNGVTDILTLRIVDFRVIIINVIIIFIFLIIIFFILLMKKRKSS